MTSNRPNPNVYPGQRVITAEGAIATVAFTAPDGRTFVYDRAGTPRPVRVAFDAFGGEPALDPGVTPRTSLFTGPPSGPHSRRSRPRLRLAA
jgi:hypothetical protein